MASESTAELSAPVSIRPVVAMCSVGELFGGVERHLLGMCQWFRRQEIEPLLMLFHDRELASQARILGFEPVIIQSSGSFDLSASKEMAQILRDRKVNLVHAHGYRAMVNTALTRRHYNFAAVRTVHGLIEPSRPFSLPWLKSHAYNWLEKIASRYTRATVCYVTDDLRQKRRGDDGGGIKLTVYNGIDPVEGSYPRPDDLTQGVFNFAAVGRVSPIKGLETALEAMTGLNPDLNVVLNIIGTGPSVEKLKELAAHLHLGQRVRFLGFKKNVYDYLSHVDALIMPSYHEGLPYTILEAMSLGTPVIASQVGGLAEVLENETTAMLVQPGDVAGWTSAMTSLARQPAEALKMGKAGLEKQAAAFTLETMGEAYWKVYLDKLEQHLNDA